MLVRPSDVLRRALFAGIVFGPVACTCPGDFDQDADYFSRDAGTDARDARQAADTRISMDANRDAPVPEGDPGWNHVAALPEECEIDVAQFPDRVLAPFVWASDCGAGCERWGNTANLWRVEESGGLLVGALIAETPPGAMDQRRYVVFAELETERALLALRDRANATIGRGQPFCSVEGTGVGANVLTATAGFFDYDASGDRLERSWMSTLRAEADDAARSLRELARRDDWTLSAMVMRPTPTHVGILWDWAVPSLIGNDGSFAMPTAGLGDTGPKYGLEVIGESDMLWEAWRTPTVLVRSEAGAAPEVIRSVDGGETRGSDLRSFAADDDTLVWLEARGYDDSLREYESVTLWTGQYVDGEIASPRRVTDVRGHMEGGVGDGYYVHAEPDPDDPLHPYFAFYRLSDGARAIIDPSPLAGNRILYVSEAITVVEAFGQIYRLDARALTFE